MSSSLEMLSVERSSTGFGPRWRGRTKLAADRDGTAPVRIWPYLPLVLLSTASVVLLPAVLVTVIVPRGSALELVASLGLAVAASIAIASAEAAAWKRRRGSRDILFADLMLWGWLRRYWAERRLAQARELYDAARKAGPTASTEQLASLSQLLEARDAYTYGHSQRVARHAERIARAMRLPPVEIAKVGRAAAVHDVGKLYTPREILNNPKRLTDVEFAVMKRHAANGANMFAAAVGDLEVAAMVRHHHERMDGHGYPDGLVGADIPLGARIIAVADTFDSITSNRAYRPADTQERALNILAAEAGSQLDGAVVAAFLHSYSARRSVAWFAFATAVPERILAGLQSVPANLAVNVGGVASILPALGAASLLTMSPGFRHGTSVDRGTSTQSRQLTISAAPTPETQRHELRRTANTRPPSSDGHRRHGTVHASPTTPAARNPTAATPNGPPSAPVAGTHEPASGPPAPAPTPRGPTPPPAFPINGAPPLPAAPVDPPVTIPTVTLPNATVPNVSLPHVTTPTIEVPRIRIPSLG
jgi:putative nucleotidyltransferase with HDIG domain